ncbi:MAG: PTS mannitol transporter subunit IICBA [Tyzzerella sp.]|nr:PTS mannitol transporter subunit IICBA [Tyzzerella sp.]
MKNALQRFGKFLSAMVMPNIGAFIAWGFITALFIPDGWIPNEDLASIHPFMLNYLLPALIAYTGGKMVGGDRGGVMGAIAVMGCVAGSSQPMLMAAMVMGPLAGWLIKKFDKAMDGRMPAGFEMLINNFSIGIFGMILAIIGYFVIGPFMTGITNVLTAGVDVLVENSLLPLAAILVEPAKVLFLNNAINHGVFTPIGVEQAAEAGKSIMYMIEANPGPGLGVLLAYWFASKDKNTRDSAPGAIIIHFLGGIHEIYFPYILMNPVVIIGPIVANICAIAFYSITNCGLVGPASPGSIIAFLAVSPKDQILVVLLGVALAAVISFFISSFIIKLTEGKTGKSLEEAKQEKDARKAESKGQVVANVEVKAGEVKKIIFACDAGMGSSAMGATKFRNRIKDARPDITVKNTSVDNIPADCDIAVVQATLQDRAKASAPNAKLVIIGNFLADPALDALYEEIVADEKKKIISEEPVVVEESKNVVLAKESIKLNQPSVSKEEAIRAAGELLVARGAVEPSYVEAMLERERLVTTYMGMGIAIPHGTSEAKGTVKKTAITMLQYPEGVDFGDEKAQLVFGIAGIGEEHLDLLGKIAGTLDDPEVLDKMKTTDDVDWILETLS